MERKLFMTNNKIFAKPVKKLDDEFLKNVAGGDNKIVVIEAISGITIAAGLGCSIATCVYNKKANEAKSKGNEKDYAYYSTQSNNCAVATAALVGTGVLTPVAINLIGLGIAASVMAKAAGNTALLN